MERDVFRKSSFCTDGGSCVEVHLGASGVAVRDSKDQGSALLRFDPAEWSAFVAGVKAGEFDL